MAGTAEGADRKRIKLAAPPPHDEVNNLLKYVNPALCCGALCVCLFFVLFAWCSDERVRAFVLRPEQGLAAELMKLVPSALAKSFATTKSHATSVIKTFDVTGYLKRQNYLPPPMEYQLQYGNIPDMSYIASLSNFKVMHPHLRYDRLRHLCDPHDETHPHAWSPVALDLLDLVCKLASPHRDINAAHPESRMTATDYNDFVIQLQNMAITYDTALQSHGYTNETVLPPCGILTLHCCTCESPKNTSYNSSTITPSAFRVVLVSAAIRALTYTFKFLESKKTKRLPTWYNDCIRALWVSAGCTDQEEISPNNRSDCAAAYDSGGDSDQEIPSNDNLSCADFYDTDSDSDLIPVDYTDEQSRPDTFPVAGDGLSDDVLRNDQPTPLSKCTDLEMIVSDEDDGYENDSPLRKQYHVPKTSVLDSRLQLGEAALQLRAIANTWASQCETINQETQHLTVKLQEANQELIHHRTLSLEQQEAITAIKQENSDLIKEVTDLKQALLAKTQVLGQITSLISTSATPSLEKSIEFHALEDFENDSQFSLFLRQLAA